MTSPCAPSTAPPADLVNQVKALARKDQRQQARALAHAALAAHPGAALAHAAVAWIACEEGFLDLAEHHLRLLPPKLAQALVPDVMTQLAIERVGALGLHESSVADCPPEALESALQWALDAGRGEAARLLASQVAACVGPRAEHPPWAQDLLDSLDPWGPADAGVLILVMPPWTTRRRAGDDEFPTVLMSKWRHWIQPELLAATSLSRFWLRRLTARSPALARIVPADERGLATAAEGAAAAIAIVPEASLAQRSAAAWQALSAWPGELILFGLTVADPDLLQGPIGHRLRNGGPVGARDEVSASLLHEAGVHCFVSGPWRPWSPVDAAALHSDLQRTLEHLLTRTMPAADAAKAVREAMPARWHPVSAAEPPAAPAHEPALAQIRAGARDLCTLPGPWIEVALAVDEQQVEHAPVVIDSALRHSTRPIRFHLLCRGLGEAHLAPLVRLVAGRGALRAYPCDTFEFGPANLLAHTSVSTLDRLLLAELLPDIARVAYLDVDLLVCGDLLPLFETNLQGHALAAKPSSSPGTRWGYQMLHQAIRRAAPERRDNLVRWLHATGPLGFRAFNAGVLVLDLDRLRRDRALEPLLRLVAHAGMNDQDALNAYTRGRYCALQTHWNAAPRQDPIADARIIHFVGPVKPWGATYILGKDLYDDAARRARQALEHGADEAGAP